MATALPRDPYFECSICYENFDTRRPKILPCGHSFCQECLVEYIGGREEIFLCPTCQQDIKLPPGGVDKLITNFALQTTTTPVKTTNILTSPEPEHRCPNHSKKEVEYYCQTCDVLLCSKCILKNHKHHKTFDLEYGPITTVTKPQNHSIDGSGYITTETEPQNQSIASGGPITTVTKPQNHAIGGSGSITTVTKPQNESIASGGPITTVTKQQNQFIGSDRPITTITKPHQFIWGCKPQAHQFIGGSEPKFIGGGGSKRKTHIFVGSNERIQTATKSQNQFIGGNEPTTNVTYPQNQFIGANEPTTTVTYPQNQFIGGNEPTSNVTNPKNQFIGANEPTSNVTYPQNQFIVANEPTSNVTNPKNQFIGGNEPTTTVTKLQNQFIWGSKPQPHQFIVVKPSEPKFIGGGGSKSKPPVPKPRKSKKVGYPNLLTNSNTFIEGNEQVPEPRQFLGGDRLTMTKSQNQSVDGSGPIISEPNSHPFLGGSGLVPKQHLSTELLRNELITAVAKRRFNPKLSDMLL